MRVLLVDDDKHVIQGVHKKIDWAGMEITEVYSALTACEAKQIIEQRKIDIIICDIEMPQETGIQLLQWIRENNYKMQAIFLTCFADFHYAQQAIKLESMEYLLKPVDYQQLEACIQRAVCQVQRNKENMGHVESGRYWEKNKETVKKNLWYKMITAEAASEILKDSFAENGFYDPEASEFLCVQITFLDLTIAEYANLQLRQLTEHPALANISKMSLETAFSLSYPVWLMVFQKTSAKIDAREQMAVVMQAIYQQWQQQYSIIMVIGRWTGLLGVRDSVAELEYRACHASFSINRILFADEEPVAELKYQAPDLSRWNQMLLAGEYKHLLNTIRSFLREEEQRCHLSIALLELFRLDLTQMIYACLSSWNISAHLLFQKDQTAQYEEAVWSAGLMGSYAEYLLDKTKTYKAFLQQPKGIAYKVKDYIDAHYCEEISREDYSSIVFMNPDYISRQFRKEIGKTISNYILEKRIHKSKELLSFTSEPIGVISMKIGYDNFAYFSKIFKEKVGMSPNEYRKTHRKEYL